MASEPVRLKVHAEGRAQRTGALLAALPSKDWPQHERARLFRQLNARAARRHSRATALAFAGAAWAVCVVVLASIPAVRESVGLTHAPPASEAIRSTPNAPTNAPGREWNLFQLGDVGLLETRERVSVDLRELDSERQLRIASGTLRAQVAHQDPARPIVVVTPHFRVVVVGTRLDVYVDGNTSSVHVLEGLVRVESALGEVYVGAGESIRSDDPRLNPRGTATPVVPHLQPAPTPRPAAAPAPRAAPPPASEPFDCNKRDGSERKRCLMRVAQGNGLAAQNALFLLGRLVRDADGKPDEALEVWSTYDRRFPDGVLAPEVALARFEILLAQRRLDEAAAVAARFEEQFDTDPRAQELQLVRAQILCATASTREQALRLFERLSTSGTPSVREAASAEAARCAAGSRGVPPP